MTTRVLSSRKSRRQNGAVLFVSLVILLVIGLLAMVTFNSSIMESKMVGSARNAQLARLAADSALSDAKIRIAQTASAYGAAQICTHLACTVRDAAAPTDPADFMQTASARAAAIPFRVDLSKLQGADETAHLAASPVYVIEDLGAVASSGDGSTAASASHDFRITAKGVGGNTSTARVIESVITINE